MPPTPADLDTCDRCLAPVLWTVTAAGRHLAVNPDPDPAGNQGVYRDGTGRWRSRGLSTERPRLEHAEWLAVPHVATCPAPRPRSSTRGRTPRTLRRPTPGWQQ